MKPVILFILLTLSGILLQKPVLMAVSALLLVVSLLIVAFNQLRKEI
jgi:hypothetical protein